MAAHPMRFEKQLKKRLLLCKLDIEHHQTRINQILLEIPAYIVHTLKETTAEMHTIISNGGNENDKMYQILHLICMQLYIIYPNLLIYEALQRELKYIQRDYAVMLRCKNYWQF